MFLKGKNRIKITLLFFLTLLLIVVGIGVYKACRVQIGMEENPLLPDKESIHVPKQSQSKIQELQTADSLTYFREEQPTSSEEIELSELNTEVESAATDLKLTTEASEQSPSSHYESMEKRASKDSLAPNQRIYRGKVFTKVK